MINTKRLRHMVDWMSIPGAEFVCELPPELGGIMRMYCQGGRVIADTESGIKFILPINPNDKSPDSTPAKAG